MATLTIEEANYLKKIKATAEYEAQIETKRATAVTALKAKDDEKTAIQVQLNSDIAAIQTNINNL